MQEHEAQSIKPGPLHLNIYTLIKKIMVHYSTLKISILFNGTPDALETPVPHDNCSYYSRLQATSLHKSKTQEEEDEVLRVRLFVSSHVINPKDRSEQVLMKFGNSEGVLSDVKRI
jgi:hypothetical protein